MESFVMELDVNIRDRNYLNNGMLLNLIKNLYVPFGIPFDPKRYYKDDVYTRILRRPRSPYGVSYLNTLYLLSEQKGLHTAEEMTEDGFKAYWLGSERVIPDKGDLRGGRHLKRHTKGKKSGARLSGGHFIRRLAHHFGMVSDDGLRGLSIMTRELLLIDMGELVKLNICMEVGDDWAWVAQGAERQPVAAVTAPMGAEDAPDVDEGAQTIPAPVHAPPLLPLAVGRTMP
ncbi:hypothetical protein Tco_0421682 [Tanacetum coccineum]